MADYDAIVVGSGHNGLVSDLGGNYADVAGALGAWSKRIERPADFLPTLKQAIEATQSNRPAVIECVAKHNFRYSRY